MKKGKISVIIRSFNEEKWIGACLEAVFKQVHPDFEVILVDNCSTDQTVKKAQRYPVRLISIKEFLPGKAINDGIRQSDGEFVVCLSAHCIPVNERWLANLQADFDDDKVAGVYGRQEPMTFTPDTDKRDLLTVFGLDKKVQLKDSFFHNANSMFRREVWDKIPFDESISNIEDRLWAREVIKAGYKLIYEPEASVYHYHGIHQNQNKERCTNVVRIIENLGKEDGYQLNHLNLADLNVVALIPVRGEMLMLNGRPLLEHAIASARQSKYIKQVIVSTDSEEHAAVARRCGALVPFIRKPDLSGEQVDLEHVYQYSIEEMEKNGIIADVIVALQVTYPFRPAGFIDELVLRLVREGLDSVLAVKPEFGSCWKKENEAIRRIDPGYIPRKFKEPTYIGIDGLGCATYPLFLRTGRLLGDKVGILEIKDPYSSIEVRDKIGLKLAEQLAEKWGRTD
jgi:rhamnosyltransferase